MDKFRILVADDEESVILLLSGILKKEGYDVDTVGDGQEAKEQLGRREYDMVISDLRMPKIDGLELVNYVRSTFPETLVILLTAHGTIDLAVEAMKRGAWDFLTKPLESPDQLRLLAKKALEQKRLTRDHMIVKESKRLDDKDTLIYHDEIMSGIMKLVEIVAPTDSTVLITGQSGTGKEMVARQIHQLSQRADKPFIAVNCAALPENLLESELFGHEKGAFTGASAKKIGFFEMAHESTLFLDEIAETSPAMQVKLLRALQERTFTRVGGTNPVKVNVRVIAATNRDLTKAVADQSFREDLFYRLNVFPVNLPPLRERTKDILPLAQYFLQKFARKAGKIVPGLTPAAAWVLGSYHWPGNARELSNVIERAVILCPSGESVSPFQLGIHPTAKNEGRPQTSGGRLQSIERDTIVRVLEENGGNRKQTAQQLGISLRSLYYKLKDYNIEPR